MLNDEHTDRKYVLFFLTGWGKFCIFTFYMYILLLIFSSPEPFLRGKKEGNYTNFVWKFSLFFFFFFSFLSFFFFFKRKKNAIHCIDLFL